VGSGRGYAAGGVWGFLIHHRGTEGTEGVNVLFAVQVVYFIGVVEGFLY